MNLGDIRAAGWETVEKRTPGTGVEAVLGVVSYEGGRYDWLGRISEVMILALVYTM